jgi:zinc transporter, ZIP family
MPIWATAGLWGLLAASSLIFGAAAAYLIKLPQRISAGIMAFGCGVLISAVAYDLLEDGFQEGGIWPIVIGAIIGTVAYTLADWVIARNGGHDRKRSGDQQQNKSEGGGLAIAAGSLLDGIPESVVLGVSLLGGQSISVAMFAAIVVISALASLAGAALLGGASRQALATVNAVAAGALLTMIVDTMIPEAVAGDHKATGLLAVLGLLVAFALSNLSAT